MKMVKNKINSYTFEKLKELRKSLGMTQAQLGRRVSSYQQAVTEWENGHRDPEIKTLRKIAEALGSELKIEFVPKDKILTIKKAQAMKKAKLLVGLSVASSELEKQSPSKKVVDEKIKEIAKRLLHKKQSKLWD